MANSFYIQDMNRGIFAHSGKNQGEDNTRELAFERAKKWHALHSALPGVEVRQMTTREWKQATSVASKKNR